MTAWGVVATVAGNALEFYDFLTYSFFAVYIGRAFFPAGSELATLLLSVATFGIGFLTRPLGGLVIGSYADRAGRKPALLLTFGLMTIGTLAIVVTPTYARIGVAAPLILVVARLLQGLALGGEMGPAMSAILEGAPPHRRGLYTSFLAASQGTAIFAAGLGGLALSVVVSKEQLADWGWRVPFALGLLIVPVGAYIRRSLPETLHAPAQRGGVEVLRLVWRDHRRAIALTTMVIMTLTILGLPPEVAMLSPLVLGVTNVGCAIWGGRLADRYDRRKLMIGSLLATMVGIYPAFLLLVTVKTAWALVFVTMLVPVLLAPGSVALLVTMGDMFPNEVRSSGISITYALAVTVFGGTTQFVITWLIGVTGNPLSPAWYVIASSAVSVWAVLRLPIAPPQIAAASVATADARV
jgi:MFS family permease